MDRQALLEAQDHVDPKVRTELLVLLEAKVRRVTLVPLVLEEIRDQKVRLALLVPLDLMAIEGLPVRRATTALLVLKDLMGNREGLVTKESQAPPDLMEKLAPLDILGQLEKKGPRAHLAKKDQKEKEVVLV